MKPLRNERHERFAQLVALGSSHTAAFVSAGYAKQGANKNAARLMANNGVRTRIEELVAAAAARVEVTLESLISDAARCRDLGIWHGQINAAVLAVKELGILTGFRIEKRETRRLDPATVTDEELVAILRAGSVDVKLSPQPAVSIGYTQPGQSGETVSASHMGRDQASETDPVTRLDPIETLQTPEARAAWRTKMATRADRTKSRARSKG